MRSVRGHSKLRLSRAIFRSVNSFSLLFTSFGSDGTGTVCDEGAANTGWYTVGVGAAKEDTSSALKSA